MEEQFILRLPEDLRAEVEDEINRLGHPMGEIEVKENGEIVYKHRNRYYKTLVVRLPCIVESYKTIDNKQFCKVADISTLVIVKSDNEVLDQRVLGSCGLTPPMKYVAVRRFRKRKILEGAAESIENKIRELLEKDTRAVDTTIVYHNNEIEEKTINSIAEEIEASLLVEKSAKQEEPPRGKEQEAEKDEMRRSSTSEIEEKIAKLEEAIKIAVNPILKKRFVDSLNKLREMKAREKEKDRS